MNYSEEVLWNQLENVRSDTLGLVRNLNQSLIDSIPAGFNNNIRWNVGHIIYDQEVWFHHLIDDTMDDLKPYQAFYDFGTSPKTWTSEPPTWEELVRELELQPKRLKQKFAGRLDEPLQRVTEAGMSRIGEVIPRTLFHEGYHLAVIRSIERVLHSVSRP